MKNRMWFSGLVTAVCAMSVMMVSAAQGNMTDVYEAYCDKEEREPYVVRDTKNDEWVYLMVVER